MRVLLAYDGSHGAEAVLRDLSLAGLPLDSEVLVLSVVDAWVPPEAASPPAIKALPRLAELRAQVRSSVARESKRADDTAQRLRREFPTWEVSGAACADTPGWAIIRRAEGLDGGVGGQPADLVVVGSRGLGRLKRVTLGSVSRKVLSEVRCSVRIARVSGDRAAAGSPPRIVIGVDGSEDSRDAVYAVARRRWPAGTKVLIAGFDQFALAGDKAFWTSDPLGDEPHLSSRSWLGHFVSASAVILSECPGLSLSAVLKPGDPKRGLVELARRFEKEGADCVFVGARGLRRIERFLRGSVSTAVATDAPCSVEVVQPRQPARAD